MWLDFENSTLFNSEKLKFVFIDDEFIIFFSENAEISSDKKWKHELKEKKKVSDQIVSNIIFKQYFDQLSSNHDLKIKKKSLTRLHQILFLNNILISSLQILIQKINKKSLILLTFCKMLL